MKRHGRVVFWLSGGARGKLITMGLMVALIVVVFTNQLPAAKTWTYWTLPLSGKTIVLDPGHGGADGGAKSADGLWEKDVTLNISMYLKDYLQQAGANVVMTRDTDTDLAAAGTKGFSRRKTEDLKERAAIVRETKPDLFLSVHLNAIPQPQWYGPQTFYTMNHKDNAAIAWFIQEELRTSVVETHRQSKRIRNIFILDRSEVPTALVEVGFLSNAAEAANLGKTEYQKQLAAAIYRGLLRYTSGETPPLEPTGGAPDGEAPSETPMPAQNSDGNPESKPEEHPETETSPDA
ncbi:N-acetylmuramoyl-L-alanine amidase CwlD [Paenibacillus sp.]|uniref:N-acetylmuramoyl-L-alanine amidase CwlD n=1 Tax=Paenibacillus sp. TaxID=58172 RepID=UPI0028110701|nr:N-acetylmuramoyl-L-alanine amidase CwlD [Paenibacillus sp.]